MLDPTRELDCARAIFFPYVAQRKAQLAQANIRLAHYCAAESAVSIIRNQEIWMRSAAVMNDSSEVEYGMQLLLHAYQQDAGAQFKAAIDDVFPSTLREVTEFFDSYRWELRGETYLTSVSEHHPRENELGRLSMWRSYGGSAGVALVLRPEAISFPDEPLAGFALPVLYADQEMFERTLRGVTQGILQARDFIRERGQAWFLEWLHFMLRSLVLSTKHPGFAEEREWRVIHSPATVASGFLQREIVTIAGVPQIVYKIPLREPAHPGGPGLNIASLIERVIIGPTQHPAVMGEAFAALLADAGVADAKERIGVSAIPLRHP